MEFLGIIVFIVVMVVNIIAKSKQQSSRSTPPRPQPPPQTYQEQRRMQVSPPAPAQQLQQYPRPAQRQTHASPTPVQYQTRTTMSEEYRPQTTMSEEYRPQAESCYASPYQPQTESCYTPLQPTLHDAQMQAEPAMVSNMPAYHLQQKQALAKETAALQKTAADDHLAFEPLRANTLTAGELRRSMILGEIMRRPKPGVIPALRGR